MFNEKVLNFVNECEKECQPIFEKLEQIALYNQNKVLNAFKSVNLQLTDIASSTGYGSDDRSRGKLAEIYYLLLGQKQELLVRLLLVEHTLSQSHCLVS